MGKIVDTTDENIKGFFDDTLVMLDITERLKEEIRPSICGKRFMTDTQLAQRLGITKRALQDYRDRGIISYYRLDGKILYSEDDVDEFLKLSYRPKYC